MVKEMARIAAAWEAMTGLGMGVVMDELTTGIVTGMACGWAMDDKGNIDTTGDNCHDGEGDNEFSAHCRQGDDGKINVN
jgi:hypothetical protein